MKSLLISQHYFPPQIGGISTMMWEVCRALGPERVCALTAVGVNDRLPARLEGIRVFRNEAVFSKSRLRQFLALATAFVGIGIAERPSYLLLAACDEAYLGYYMRKSFGIPYVVFAHGNDILSAATNSWPVARTAMLAASRVIANSRYSAELLHKMGVSGERTVVINPGCNVDRFFPRAATPEIARRIFGKMPVGPVLLTVGGLVPRKGQDVVLRAIPRLLRKHPDLRYLIVGYGPERERLEREVAELGITTTVIFAGKAPHEELLDYFAVSDIFVMPSHINEADCDVEGFGIVFLEANACEKPVVAGRSGGIPDAVIDGVTGLLVDPFDVTALASSIETLLANPAFAQRLGRQGRERALRDFSWPTVAAKVGGVLDGLDVERRLRNPP